MMLKRLGLKLLMVIGILVCLLPVLAKAADPAPTAPNSFLTVVLRDGYGHPLEAVRCEVLSYDWGLPVGQPYAVIADGQTDPNGAVAFDVSVWPRTGYRFRFSPTRSTRPRDTYFEPPDRNQYRGFPAAVVGGVGRSEKQFFVLAGDGLAYNDTSSGEAGSLPTYGKDPVGGLERPRTTIMPSEDFLATVRAATATAEAQGTPAPTRPPAPPPFTPGQVQSALTITPAATASGLLPPPTPTAAPVQDDLNAALAAKAVTVAAIAEGPPNHKQSQSQQTPAVSSGGSAEGSLLTSLGLALLGGLALVLFWKFRHRLYPWLGVEGRTQARSRKRLPGPDELPDAPTVGGRPVIREESQIIAQWNADRLRRQQQQPVKAKGKDNQEEEE